MEDHDEDARVVSALRESGVIVSNVYDLVNTKRAYKSAIPALIELLREVQNPTVKEGVIRALAVKEAVGTDAVDRLIAEFKRSELAQDERGRLLKWIIGNTLSVIARDPDFMKIAELAKNKQYGKAREMVVMALGNMRKTPEAVDVLIELLSDDEVCGHAAKTLGKLKAKRAEKDLKKLLNHQIPWIRTAAQRALERIKEHN